MMLQINIPLIGLVTIPVIPLTKPYRETEILTCQSQIVHREDILVTIWIILKIIDKSEYVQTLIPFHPWSALPSGRSVVCSWPLVFSAGTLHPSLWRRHPLPWHL